MNNLRQRLKIEDFKKKVKYIRKLVLDMCIRAQTGHVTSCFSCAEVLVALYYGGFLKFNPENPKWSARDLFVLSKGQASPILYAVLADCGFFHRQELKKFCQADGMFGVHLQHDVPGVEITSGSLGHGLGIAAGIALSLKMDNKPNKVFTLLGDGECYEGSIWETAMFASHHKLNNLLAIVDRNQLCVTGFTEEIVRLNPMDEKFRSFGWDAAVIDGHSFEEIFYALDKFVCGYTDKPTAIIVNTVKGKGISFMENQRLWHGMAPKGREASQAMRELDKCGE